MQNDTPITVKWATLKPEVEFQHGGRLYLEIGNIEKAANGDIWTKFGLLIDFDLLSEGSDINKYETGSSV